MEQSNWNDAVAALEHFCGTANEEWQHLQTDLPVEALLQAAQLIEDARSYGGRLHFSGIGKASYVAAYCASLFSSTGTPGYVLHGTEATHGSCGQLLPRDIVVLISNSGKTEELLRTAAAVHDMGCRIIAVTGNLHSPLAQCAALTLHAPIRREGGPLGRAPRMSVIAQIYTLMAVSVILQSRVGQTPEQYLRCHPGGTLGKSGTGIAPSFSSAL